MKKKLFVTISGGIIFLMILFPPVKSYYPTGGYVKKFEFLLVYDGLIDFKQLILQILAVLVIGFVGWYVTKQVSNR